MIQATLPRRAALKAALLTAGALALAQMAPIAVTPAVAAGLEPFTYMTSWYAQAEHGGFYQAKATGLYEKAGLDVTIKMGGPQVNGMQLLLAGEADIYNGFDFQVLSAREQGLPLKAVAAMFQHDVNGLVTHPDVAGLDDIGDRTILVATAARASFWPWLKAKYGLSDAQVKPYTFNIQPFIIDDKVVQQAFPSSEPFALREKGVPYNFFLFADEGYPPYGITLVTRDDVIAKRREALQRFVRASVEGWKSYLADPGPGNALIKEANPKMTDAQLAFALDQIKAHEFVTGGDAKTMGIGTMTPQRWQASYDYMVSVGLLKPETDWQSAFTNEFVKDLDILPD